MMHRKVVHYTPMTKYIMSKRVVSQAGSFLTFLYEVFITKEKKFNADTCRLLGFCPGEVSFIEWLRALEAHKLISIVWCNPYHYRYISMGPYLLDKWKNVMVTTQCTATKTDIREIQEDIATLHQIIEAFAKKVGVVYDPPDFKELRKFLYQDIEAPF